MKYTRSPRYWRDVVHRMGRARGYEDMGGHGGHGWGYGVWGDGYVNGYGIGHGSTSGFAPVRWKAGLYRPSVNLHMPSEYTPPDVATQRPVTRRPVTKRPTPKPTKRPTPKPVTPKPCPTCPAPRVCPTCPPPRVCPTSKPCPECPTCPAPEPCPTSWTKPAFFALLGLLVLLAAVWAFRRFRAGKGSLARAANNVVNDMLENNWG